MPRTSDDATTNPPKPIWLNVLVFSLTGLTALIGLPIYCYFYDFNFASFVAFFIATGFCGMSITAGYHRLWSHRAYEAHPFVRAVFAIGGAFAVQNSALHWASDHRVHHRHVDDNDRDPYSAKKGFWYSHIGWMLREYQAHRYNDYENVRDLKKDKIVLWQHKHYLKLVLLTNFGIPIAFGLINGNVLGSFLLIGVLRLVVSHHVTFCINSLAHLWGAQPYSDDNTAKDNPIVALLTYGEGYHNFHHAFENDYRNAIKWWQFDPTKWLIRSLSFIGLAKNLRRVAEDKIAKAIAAGQLARAKRKLIQLNVPDKEALIQRVQQEYDALIVKMNAFYEAKKLMLEHAKADFRDHYQELQYAWLMQKKSWQRLVYQYA